MKKTIFLFILLGINIVASAQTPYFPQFNKEKDSWHYLDVDGNKVLELKIPNIQNLQPFSDGLAAVQDQVSHLWGYINAAGSWEIVPTYEHATDFKDGYAIVSNTCKIDCNQNEDGLLNEQIGTIIDKKGTVILTDKSQNEDQYERFFLGDNLGRQKFTIVKGFGFGDESALIDLNGKIICEASGNFGPKGFIIYDEEMKAYRCENQYYDASGKKILDLAKYGHLNPFQNGMTWGMLEKKVGDGEYEYFYVLLDKKGQEILRFSDGEINDPQEVIDGKFLYKGNDATMFQYELKSKKSIPYQNRDAVINAKVQYGKIEANGCKFIYDTDANETLIGFMNNKGEEYYK